LRRSGEDSAWEKLRESLAKTASLSQEGAGYLKKSERASSRADSGGSRKVHPVLRSVWGGGGRGEGQGFQFRRRTSASNQKYKRGGQVTRGKGKGGQVGFAAAVLNRGGGGGVAWGGSPFQRNKGFYPDEGGKVGGGLPAGKEGRVEMGG